MSSVKGFHKFDLSSKNFNPLLESEEEGKLSTYASCLTEAISAINIMISYLAPSDPEVVDEFVSRKKQLSANIEADPQSHVEMWKELTSMASDLQSAILQSSQWEEKKIESGQLLDKSEILKKKLDSDELDFDEWKKQMDKIQNKTTAQQAKNIFFEKTKKAFKYFQEAVKAFAQCGISLLKNSGDDSDWLDDATILAAKQLSQKNK
jgi:hypothetical protein